MANLHNHYVDTIKQNSEYGQDPVVKKAFRLGDEVVICRQHKVAFLLSTYTEMQDAWDHNCPYCHEAISLTGYAKPPKKPEPEVWHHQETRRDNPAGLLWLGWGLLAILLITCLLTSGVIWSNLATATEPVVTELPTATEQLDQASSVVVPPTSRPTATTRPPTPSPEIAQVVISVPSPTSVILPADQSAIQGHIVFACFDGNDDEICVMNADGSNVTQLTNNSVGDFYPSIANSARYIVFAHQISGSNYEIFKMNLDGSGVVQLTFNGAQNYAPAFSRDDTRIVYTSNQNSQGFQIWVMDVNGNNLQKLTDESSNGDPSWSPNGQEILFVSLRSGSQQVWKMNADGSNVTQITNIADAGGRSCWSADGQSIFFYAGKRDDRSRNIYSIRADGTNLIQITDGGDNLGPTCSPFGGWVAFTSYRDGNNEIYIMQEDGTNLNNLTNSGSQDYQPRWGP